MRHMLKYLNGLQRLLAKLLRWLYAPIRYLPLVTVLLVVAIVVFRRLLSISEPALQEAAQYAHVLMIFLAQGICYMEDQQVRIDVIRNRLGSKMSSCIEIGGVLFLLLPFCLFTFLNSWEYVVRSWQDGEVSAEAGGLPFLWLLKTSILCLPALLALAGLQVFLRNICALLGPVETVEPDFPSH